MFETIPVSKLQIHDRVLLEGTLQDVQSVTPSTERVYALMRKTNEKGVESYVFPKTASITRMVKKMEGIHAGQATLSNGIRLINLNIRDFIEFEDGTILPGVSNERQVTFGPIYGEKVTCGVCGVSDIRLIVLNDLDFLKEVSNLDHEKYDFIICESEFLVALQTTLSYSKPLKFRTVIHNPDTGKAYINRFQRYW